MGMSFSVDCYVSSVPITLSPWLACCIHNSGMLCTWGAVSVYVERQNRNLSGILLTCHDCRQSLCRTIVCLRFCCLGSGVSLEKRKIRDGELLLLLPEVNTSLVL